MVKRSWPGNVRELKSIMERGVLACQGPEMGLLALGKADEIPRSAGPGGTWGGLPALDPQGLDLTLLLENVQRYYLEQALAMFEGSDVKAAKLLGLNYHTLRYRKKSWASPDGVGCPPIWHIRVD
ncbi:hypothetical protein DFAR_3240003 [Desulfarculales bacterium]